MLARIVDSHNMLLEQIVGAEDILVREFSARTPRARYLSGPWDGWYRRFNVRTQRLSVGFLDDLQECCRRNHIPLEVVDDRPAPEYPAPKPEHITKTFLNGIILEKYQVECLRRCCDKDIGLVSATTGAGKTEIICGLVKMYRCPTVIVTEQLVVLDQIVERLQLRGVVRGGVGMFCQGHLPEGELVIVGNIQSMTTPSRPTQSSWRVNTEEAVKTFRRWATAGEECLDRIFPGEADRFAVCPDLVDELEPGRLERIRLYCSLVKEKRIKAAYATRLENARKIQEMVGRCDLLLVDEADLATSKQYQEMFVKHFHGRRKYGFSGTPFDRKKPVQNLFLREQLGNIIYEVSRREVQAAGRIVPVKCVMIGFGDPEGRKDSRAFDIAVSEEIIENEAFHRLVATIPAAFPGEGTLILVDTAPIAPLGLALEQMIPGSRFVYGKTSRRARRSIVEKFEKREMTCLIGSKILRRGLDLSGGTENLVLIGGGGLWSEFEQKVGRALRRNTRGWARIFSFFMLGNKYLYKHSRENLKAIVSMGYDTRVVIGGAEIGGKEFIKSRFRIPFQGTSSRRV